MSDLVPPLVGQFLKKEHSALQRIFAKVQQLKQVNAIFIACLEPSLRRSCIVANVYAEKLVILVENAAFATQLRFATPDLLPLLRQKHPLLREIKTIECKVKTTF